MERVYQKFNDDPLIIVLFACTNFLNYKLIKGITFMIFLLHGLITLIHVKDILVNFNVELLTKYGDILSLTLSGLAGIIISVTIKSKVGALIKEIKNHSKIWALEASSVPTYKKIIRESQITTVIVILNTLLAVIAYLSYLPLFGRDKSNPFYAVHFFQQRFSKYSEIICYTYLISILLLVYLALNNAYGLIYLVSYQKFQLYIINDRLEKISAKFRKIDDFKLVRNTRYQEKIFEGLKTCIQRHVIFKRHEKKIVDLIGVPIIVITCLAIELVIIFLFNVVAEEIETDYLRVTLFGILTSTTGGITFYFGQSLIDHSIELSCKIVKCPWTAWDLRNRKMLLIFLMNTQKYSVLGIPGLLVLNYPFLIKGLKFAASASIFFAKFVGYQSTTN